MARSERPTRSLTVRHVARGGLVACGAVLAACTSILGIEDLSTEPRDAANGGAGQAGSATGALGGNGGSNGGTAGATGGRAGSGAGGNAGAAARAGSSSGGTAGAGASSGTGGSSGGGAGTGGATAGKGGEAGSPEPMTGPVSGTIIDFWRHPLAGIPVRIGDGTATTDQSGKFVVDDVPETYDAAFLVSAPNPMKVHEWVFLGLSRRDPTLQVTEAFSDYEAHFLVDQTGGGTFDAGFWYLAIGSANGSRASTANDAGFNVMPSWFGPDVNDWTLHSLFMKKTAELPTEYVAYQTETATSNASTSGMEQYFSMNLAPQSIDTGTVSGGIDPDTTEGRTNSAFVRFGTGAALPIVDRVPASAQSYQYTIPILANGDITVAAAETRDDDSYAIAHRDHVIQGAAGVDIVIPPPVSGLVPADETVNVGPDTVFSFNQGDPDNSGYLIQIESEQYQQGVFIVTTKRQITLGQVPLVNNTNLLVPNGWHDWNVQTHGQFDSVDDMAGPNGYLDSFALNHSLPQGPSTTEGAYTESVQLAFQTEP